MIATRKGLRIYGSGVLSSAGESVYCLEDPRPHRIRFDLRRVMRTRYRIDDFQQTYFVIDDFRQLFDATRPDFAPIYHEIATQPDIEPDGLVRDDRPFNASRSLSAGSHGQKNGLQVVRSPSLGRKRLEDVRQHHNQ